MRIVWLCLKNPRSWLKIPSSLGHTHSASLRLKNSASHFFTKQCLLEIVDETTVRGMIRSHPEKVSRFVHILIEQCFMALHGEEIMKALDHDAGHDHIDHIYIEVLAKATADFRSWIPPITSLFSDANSKKINSLYVDVQDSKLRTPEDAVDPEEFKRLSWFLNAFLPGFEIILDEDDSRFRRVAERMDPEFRYIFKPTTQ